MKDLILIGGGGHCKSVIDVVESEGKYKIKGIIDRSEHVGKAVLGYPILGTDNEIVEFVNPRTSFLITVGQIKSTILRKKLFDILVSLGAEMATIISPYAYISKRAIIGKGTVVMHQACLNSGVTVGENCIINTKALIEHDSHMGAHSHISTAAVINGEVKIGGHCFIGSNSVILNNIEIADECIVGAGSVVNKSILNTQKTIAGNPARIINE